jgi:hypothetical protein
MEPKMEVRVVLVLQVVAEVLVHQDKQIQLLMVALEALVFILLELVEQVMVVVTKHRVVQAEAVADY